MPFTRETLFTHKFHAFLHKEMMEEKGILIDEIESPYDVWNLPKGIGYVLGESDKKSKENGEVYSRFENDSNFVMKEVYCNN